MENLTIAVFNYSICSVEVYHNIAFDESLYEDTNEFVEEYLTDKGYHMSEIYYMVTDEGELTINEYNK